MELKNKAAVSKSLPGSTQQKESKRNGTIQIQISKHRDLFVINVILINNLISNFVWLIVNLMSLQKSLIIVQGIFVYMFACVMCIQTENSTAIKKQHRGFAGVVAALHSLKINWDSLILMWLRVKVTWKHWHRNNASLLQRKTGRKNQQTYFWWTNKSIKEKINSLLKWIQPCTSLKISRTGLYFFYIYIYCIFGLVLVQL